MNVFDLAAAIHLDKTNYDKGLDESESKGKSWTSKMGETFYKMGSMASKALATASKLGAAAIGAGTTAVAALTKMAVSSVADYEQLIGGVETLYSGTQQTLEEFAESTGRTTDEALDDWLRLTTGQRIVANNAEEAYKTVGLSMNEYMETATSFAAALASSLEGDTTAAANAADMAITDMADNANKMGTQMESIQNAYNGFSKQNYTMLDNLKLGYGGTKEEMERLIKDANELNAAQGNYTEYSIDSFADIVNAIHDVQTNMGITGTTAKEAASTISGSMAMAKAAWKNLTTALAADESEELPIQAKVEEFVDSVKTAASNVIPRVELAIAGVGQLVNELLPMIVAEIPVIASSILPDLVLTGAAMAGALLQGVIDNAPALLEGLINIGMSLKAMFDENMPAIMELGASIATYITQGLISGIPVVLEIGTDIIVNFVQGLTNAMPSITSTALTIIQSLASGLSNSIPKLIPVGLQAIITFAQELLANSDKLISAALQLITSLAEGLIQALPILISKAPILISDLISAILKNLPQIAGTGIKLVVELSGALVSSIPSLVVAAGELIAAFLRALTGAIESMVDVGFQLVEGLWQGIRNTWGNLVSNVKNLGRDLVDGVKSIFGIHSPSKVFAQIGEYCVEGFENGIDDLANGSILKDVSSQMDELGKYTAEVNANVNTGTSGEVSNKDNSIRDVLIAILEYLKNLKVVLDSGELVGGLVEKMDEALGDMVVGEGRSV
jgi:phage-related protein|nr:MAG TPA: tail tape measure protein [Caudoviricetes sp.]